MANDLLTGYDMVVALSQNNVNFQLQQLMRHGLIPRSFDMRLGKESLNITLMNPPTVDLDLRDSRQQHDPRSARLNLNCAAGSFTYFDVTQYDPDGNPLLVTEQINKFVLAFNVSLNIEETSRDAINATQQRAQPDPEAPGDKFQLVESFADFSDELFSISHLFLDFENLNVSHWDQSSSSVPGLSDAAAQALANFLGLYLKRQAAKDYILGYSVSAKPGAFPPDAPHEQAVFAPTKATFSTTANNSDATLSTLNYLIMTGANEFPASAQAGIFDTAWIPSRDVYATFVVSRALFRQGYVEQYVLPVVARAMGVAVPFGPKDDGWNLLVDRGDTVIGLNEDSGVKDVYAKHTSEVSCDASISSAGPGVVITCDGYFYLMTDFWEKWAGVRDPHATTSSKLNWTLTIELSAGDNGQVVIQTDVRQNGEIEKHTDESDYFKTADFFAKPFTKTTADQMQQVSKHMTALQNAEFKSLHDIAGAAFSSLQNKIVMPAGHTFDYKELQLNSEGDLLLHATYKSGATSPAANAG